MCRAVANGPQSHQVHPHMDPLLFTQELIEEAPWSQPRISAQGNIPST